MNGDKSFSEHDETGASLGPDVIDSGSDEDFLILEGVFKVFDFGPFSTGDEDGLEEGIVSKLVDFVVNDLNGLDGFHGTKKSC